MVAMKLSISPSSVRIRGLADGPRVPFEAAFPWAASPVKETTTVPRQNCGWTLKIEVFSIGLRAGFFC